MKKYLVFSQIFNNYEPVREVEVKDENADYVLFTDNKETTSNTWKVIYLDLLDTNDIDGYQKNILFKYTFYKFFQKFLPNINDYDYFFQIDMSISIEGSLQPIINYMRNNNYDLSVAVHPDRDNFISEYAAWCSFRNLDRKYPTLFFNLTKDFNTNEIKGLCETTIKVWHNCQEIFNFIDDIHNLVILGNCGDKNDQCYFTYVLYKYLDRLKVNFHSAWLYNYSKYMKRNHHGQKKALFNEERLLKNKNIKFLNRDIVILEANDIE